MLRKILLDGEALAGKEKDPEFFISDADFAEQIRRSEYAVWRAKPVLRKLGIVITMRKLGDEAKVENRHGRKGYKPATG